MKIEYEIVCEHDITDSIRSSFADALKKQGKVTGDLIEKADRCKILCVARINGNVVGIGAIKRKTKSDFSVEKAAIPELENEFQWELGYFYTDPMHSGMGIAKNVARLLLDEYGNDNLMASTEISANPAMVKILEVFGFRLFGKPWIGGIHQNYLGLFLKFK